MNKLSLNLLLLAIFFYPLKFFSFKILGGIELSFFKIFSSLYVLLYFKSYFLNRTYSNIKFQRWSIFFFCFIFFTTFINFASSSNFSLRAFLNILSFILIFCVFFMGYSHIKKLHTNDDKYYFYYFSNRISLISKIWYLLIFYSLIQFILFYFGINLSFENINEYAPENQGEIFGINSLRPNSFFGEPRDLACFIIPIIFFYKYIRNIKLSILDWCFIVLIGLLTQSSTFFIVLLLSIFFLILRRSFFAITVLSVIFIFLIIPYIDLIFEIVPRLVDFSKLNVVDSESFDKELIGQLGDVSLINYLINSINSSVGMLTLLIGNGLGSSSDVILSVVNETFLLDIKSINSRFLIYTLIVDIGIFGVFIFYKIIKLFFSGINYKLNNNETSTLAIFVIGSIFTSSYLFLLIILLIINFNIYRNEKSLG